jgi:hypothetical protein
MAEIRNYTMNSSSGPLEGVALTLNFSCEKLASTEIHRWSNF